MIKNVLFLRIFLLFLWNARFNNKTKIFFFTIKIWTNLSTFELHHPYSIAEYTSNQPENECLTQ